MGKPVKSVLVHVRSEWATPRTPGVHVELRVSWPEGTPLDAVQAALAQARSEAAAVVRDEAPPAREGDEA